MKKILLLLVLTLMLKPVLAQDKTLDSLIEVSIERSRNEKVVPVQNPDSLLKRFPLIKSPAERIRLIYDIILFNSGELDFKKALYYHRKILDLTKQYKDPICEAVILSELGFTIAENGNSPEGLKMIFKSLAMAEATHNSQAIGIVYDNLGVVFDTNPAQEIVYFKKGLRFSLAGSDYSFAAAEMANLSDAYHQLNKIDSARYYLDKSIRLTVDKDVMLVLLTDLIHLGLFQTDEQAAMKYYRMALLLPVARRDIVNRNKILSVIAASYKRQGKTDSALYYAKEAFAGTKDKFIALKLFPANLLASLYKGKNADSALKYSTIYYTLRDSMYSFNKVARNESTAFAEQQKQQELETQKIAYQNTVRAWFLTAIICFLLVLAYVFWRSNSRNKKDKQKIQSTLEELRLTQRQLIQSEKMASLGELTAGIAHEIQNPLNFVNNFSEVNQEMLEELKTESKRPKTERDEQLEIELINDLIANEEKINHHGKRADAIVKGMLQHSRASSGQKEPTDINALADEYLRLAYHGLRAKDKSFNAELITIFDEKLPRTNVIPQDIGRVLLNLFTNAFYAINQKVKTSGADYKPELTVTTSIENGQVIIKVKDNGVGIPDAIKEKIMQPFFTTKPTGEGTGLGLSLSYDILVKGHNGTLDIISKEGEGAEFIISIPVN